MKGLLDATSYRWRNYMINIGKTCIWMAVKVKQSSQRLSQLEMVFKKRNIVGVFTRLHANCE